MLFLSVARLPIMAKQWAAVHAMNSEIYHTCDCSNFDRVITTELNHRNC